MIESKTNSKQSDNTNMNVSQNDIKNEKLKNYYFLVHLYHTPYCPDSFVDQGKAILIDLCLQIEKKHPTTLSHLYQLTHAAINKFNNLDFFLNDGSEPETITREIISDDFGFIAKAYGFDVNWEDLNTPRN